MQEIQTPFPAPNWREWKSLPSVQAWEACALSLNLDPYSVDASSRDDLGTLYERHRFPSQEVADEFDARLRWLLRRIAPRLALSLPEFAELAVSVMAWPDLPPELVALAQTAERSTGHGQAEVARIKAEAEHKTSPAARRAMTATEYTATKRICGSFPPPKGVKSENWESGKYLSDCPQWLKEARESPGKRGVPALWNPAKFALAMVSESHIGKGQAAAIIRREFPEWLDTWERLAENLT